MKKLLAIMALFSTSVYAQTTIYMRPTVSWDENYAEGRLCNYHSVNIRCRGQMFAQIQDGRRLTTNQNYTYLAPGQCFWMYIHSYQSAPIIDAWGDAYCIYVPPS